MATNLNNNLKQGKIYLINSHSVSLETLAMKYEYMIISLGMYKEVMDFDYKQK